MNTYQFNLERSELDERDFMLESIYPEEVILPKVWDLRPEMMPIRDQGQQGTCSAQTVSAMKEWQELKDVGFSEYMSPQFVYNLRSNQSSSGMTPKDTMDILYKQGIVPEKEYPYENSKPISDKLLKKSNKFKIQGYAKINTIDALKKALFANGPCYIAFPVYNSNKMEFWKPDNISQKMLGGHAVCVAGYLEDRFIIRNSWSTQWGDKGYTYFPFSQWGHQWECWTTVDAESGSILLQNKSKDYTDKKSVLRRIMKRIFKK